MTASLSIDEGSIGERQGDTDAAIADYRRALSDEPDPRIASRKLAMLLVRLGRAEESIPLWHAELLEGAEGSAWISDLISSAMRSSNLALAGEYATIFAALRWGSRWYPARDDGFIPTRPASEFLSIPKLRHDIDQFLYLQRRHILGAEFTPIIRNYEGVIERLTAKGIEGRVPPDRETRERIGHVYNRIVHIRDTPRVERALSTTWDANAVEMQYLSKAPGVVVVDHFLSDEALESLRLFCLESTMWSGNRYQHGRLGAFFQDGFNCPLLLQIAEELRSLLPRVIGVRYPLRQLWGYKYQPRVPGDSSIHADFAAINVNFWITPDDANLDPDSGGLVVYDVDAPLDWDFDAYNCSPDLIRAFIRQQNAGVLNIPYRQNRAVIFNSDLFHCTADLRFRPGYENTRMNVTMLYGERENDTHYRPFAARRASSPAWRSAAFTRRK